MASFGDLPAAIFSPSKMAYIAYVGLIALKILPAPSLWEFLGLSLVFWVAQVFHDDFLRIWLNNKAKKLQ